MNLDYRVFVLGLAIGAFFTGFADRGGDADMSPEAVSGSPDERVDYYVALGDTNPEDAGDRFGESDVVVDSREQLPPYRGESQR
jgi:hypothetical protein